ncbi:pyridoxamine 5'-phosphate oxidase family protein [Oceanirhabdus seepicola]|uniref:Pyridoxamine 5'-phosphate oxidase family protein n=1 Tax=Oceanirhabdus seepicola TaxID=2828781 RepID=A0A9J6NYE7_9CLOT|nr:pyridoxamine 5'-phosphate oxidase family protein [Oceanirhabdus seepicola]MCM1989076.1 pyridoxamine 5'-phosphate oxidase family protein [Oceanirhabdus seepicola]
MKKIVDYLNENRIGQFGTIKDGQVNMRPFHFLFEKEGKFIFATANNKEVYKELQENPTASFAVLGQDGKWVRLRGKVTFSDSMELRNEIFEMEPLVEKVYKSPDNPIFEVFCIHDGIASLHGGTGQVIEEVTF